MSEDWIDVVATTLAVMASTGMAVVAILTLQKINKTSSFRWVKRMFYLCIIQDIGTAIFYLSIFFEEN